MVRPIVLRRPAVLAVLALTWAASLGCASDETRRDQALAAREAARAARPSHVQQATYAEDDPSSQMTVQGEEGTLNAADVESALHDHFGEIRDCYRLGRKAPQRPSGRVMLRFFVDAKGEVDDVSIVESNIGNHAIERCIADIGLGVVFERPAGGKPTTFDYPVEFRPARPLTADSQRRPCQRERDRRSPSAPTLDRRALRLCEHAPRRETLSRMVVSDAILHFAEEPNHEIPGPPPPGKRFVRPNFTLGLSPTRTHAFVSRLRTTAAELDATIADVRELLREYPGVWCQWSLGPSCRPVGVAQLLKERGFVPPTLAPFEPSYSVMLLTSPPPARPPAPAVEARLVESYDEYERALRAGFKASEMSEEDIASWVDAAPALWRDASGLAQQTHIAFVDGHVAAFGFAAPGAAAVLLAGSAVLPEFRGRGAYRALVASRWSAAVATGKPALAVHAGAMSRPILARCGFEEVCGLEVLVDPTLG